MTVATWSEFAAVRPGLASAIRGLVHPYGPGLGYLATIRRDGGPRVHPVSPVILDDGLYCFIVNSPKRGDLDRDGRYALHAFPPEETDDEAYLSGRASRVLDGVRVRRLAAVLRAEPRVDWWLYEFTVEVAMVARRGSGAGHEVWRDPGAAGWGGGMRGRR
jgi:Pyridoxamine 5'-phosphate oxidase